MTQPPDSDLPTYGSVPPQDPTWGSVPPPTYYAQPYPTPPPGYSQPPQKDRAPDIALSWVLFALQVVGAVVMWIISIFAYVVVTLCEGGSDACTENGAGGVVTVYWIALFVLVVGTLIGMIVATSTKRAVWPWAVGGFFLTVIATIVFFAAIPG